MTVTHNDNETIIGRAEINDIEAILAIPNTDSTRSSTSSRTTPTPSSRGTTRSARPALRKLYEKAKVGQWNATTDLPWDTEVDLEKTVAEDQALIGTGIDANHLHRHAGREVGRQGVARVRHREPQLDASASSCTASRARCCAPPRSSRRCRGTTPSCTPPRRSSTRPATSRSSPATSTRSSAASYQINAHLRMLLDDIVNDSRWDMTYLGMQVMVEGLALAAFGFMHQITNEPLLKQLLRYVMSDEARHVAFGVLVAEGGLRRHDRRRDEGPPGVRLRGRRPHARPLHAAGGVGAHGRQRRATSCRCVLAGPDPRRVPADAVLQDRARTARSSACSTATTSGCAAASRRWASSSSRTGRTPARSTSSSSSARTSRRRLSTPSTSVPSRWRRLKRIRFSAWQPMHSSAIARYMGSRTVAQPSGGGRCRWVHRARRVCGPRPRRRARMALPTADVIDADPRARDELFAVPAPRLVPSGSTRTVPST